MSTEDAQQAGTAQTKADSTMEAEDGGHRVRSEARVSGSFTGTALCQYLHFREVDKGKRT